MGELQVMSKIEKPHIKKFTQVEFLVKTCLNCEVIVDLLVTLVSTESVLRQWDKMIRPTCGCERVVHFMLTVVPSIYSIPKMIQI